MRNFVAVTALSSALMFANGDIARAVPVASDSISTVGSGPLPLIYTESVSTSASSCGVVAGESLTSACGYSANPIGPVVAVSANTSGSGAVIGFDAELLYYAQVVGPASANGLPMTIPVLISSTLNAFTSEAASSNANPAPGAFSALSITDNGADVLFAEACSASADASGVCGGYTGLATVQNYQANVPIGDTLQVELFANAGSITSQGGIDIEEAFVDPSIVIDPSFLADNPGYSLELSAGIGDPTGVPESPSIVLLASGLLGAGAFYITSRRRKNRCTASVKIPTAAPFHRFP